MARKWYILALTSLGVFMAFLDTTVVNIAFTDIIHAFAHTRISDLSWILNGYTVIFAASLIPAGRFADLLGRKPVFLVGLIVFTTASALSGLAPSPVLLIAARVVQGVGAAAMIPSALGLVLAEFPASQRATAVGLWSMAGALAGAAGPPLGGVIVQLAGWRWVFFINVPIGALAIVLTWRTLTEHREAVQARLPDLLGAAALAGTVSALALGIVKGQDWGWMSARTLACYAVAVCLLLIFLVRSARHPAPVMELGLWRVRSFSIANLATFIYAMGFFAMFLAAALFLTGVWHYSTIKAGLAIAPGPAVAAIVGGFAGRAADRWGQRLLIVPGQMIVAASLLWLVTHLQATPAFLGLWLPAFALTGFGVGLSLPGLASAAVASLPPNRFATGGAVNNTARQIGAALGVALLVAIVGNPASAQALAAFKHGFAFSAACAILCSVLALALGRVRVLTPLPAALEQTGAVTAA